MRAMDVCPLDASVDALVLNSALSWPPLPPLVGLPRSGSPCPQNTHRDCKYEGSGTVTERSCFKIFRTSAAPRCAGALGHAMGVCPLFVLVDALVPDSAPSCLPPSATFPCLARPATGNCRNCECKAALAGRSPAPVSPWHKRVLSQNALREIGQANRTIDRRRTSLDTHVNI